eukprot:376713-Prorocentrum_lima.AAC.1
MLLVKTIRHDHVGGLWDLSTKLPDLWALDDVPHMGSEKKGGTEEKETREREWLEKMRLAITWHCPPVAQI